MNIKYLIIIKKKMYKAVAFADFLEILEVKTHLSSLKRWLFLLPCRGLKHLINLHEVKYVLNSFIN
jgi:hypothetical protein